MARKKLLSEGEIRQFMKLANLRPIGHKRLSEMYDMPGARDEEDELRDELDATEDELGDEDALADEEGDELDAMAMDDAGGGDMVSMDDFMSALERAIEDVTGEEADVSEEPGDEEVEMDMEMDVEEDPMMEQRKGHGGGARSDDPARNKRGKFGKPDEEESEVLPDDDSDDSPVRRGRGSSGHRPDKMNEDEIVAEIVRRLAERQGADDREDEHLGAKDGKESGKKQSMKDRRKEMRGARRADDEDGDPVPTEEGLADARPAPHRKPRMQRRDDDEGYGAIGGMMDEPSELEPGTPYDPSEEIPRSKRGAKGRYRRDESVDSIVNEVASRVAKRLQAQTAKEQMVDQLAERIMKRLTK